MNQNRVSIIVAAYNAEKTLRSSVKAILAQTHTSLNVIIIDDKSQDKTLSVAKEIAATDPRVTVIESEKNGGPAKARNLGLAVASGEWVAIVDSDDEILPERIAAMAAQAEESAVDIVFDNLFYVTPKNGTEHLYIPRNLGIFGSLPLEIFIRSHRRSVAIPNLGFLKPLIRRELLEKNNLRYDVTLKIGEDAMLIMDLMARGAKAILLPDAYYRYHRHDGSISATQDRASVAAITDSYREFLNRYQGQIDSGAVQVMQELIVDNMRRIEAEDLVSEIFKGKLIRVACMLIKSPQLIKPVIKNAGSRIKKSLRS